MAQMPQEGRKFGIVDRYWREIMGEAVKDHHALVATAQENMLDKLNESNVLLEEIQKGLNDYLEKKRLYFPRWAWQSSPSFIDLTYRTIVLILSLTLYTNCLCHSQIMTGQITDGIKAFVHFPCTS